VFDPLHSLCIGSATPSLIEKDTKSPVLSHFGTTPNHPKVAPGKAKRLPGNRAASSLGRIVPTEAKPSELSGEILSLAKYRVKAKTRLA